jgi:hypothetical protein
VNVKPTVFYVGFLHLGSVFVSLRHPNRGFEMRSKLSLTPTARRRLRPEELGTLVQVVLYFRAATFKDSEGNDIQLYEPPRN